jgi:Tc toxin complex TcA C-terminal TcB-binding domain
LEKTDAGTLALLQQTTQQQLLADGSQILDWQVQQAQSNIDALNQTLALAQQKYDFNSTQTTNPAEVAGMALKAAAALLRTIAAAAHTTAAVVYLLPAGTAGAAGVGGSPQAAFTEGGKNAGDSSKAAGWGATNWADYIDMGATAATTIGGWLQRQANWDESAQEATIQITQANNQLNAANFALQIAQQNQTLHQEQIDNIQKQIDFLNNKFTSDSLYDWMVSSLSATYFQSYQLAYQMCKQVERCYQFELGIQDTSFIQFGYWDSLHKGLLAGETLNHDLRRMQASYLQQNARRYELSRYVSLGVLNPAYLQQLLETGKCDFTLRESLFDNDYPGHYNRRLTRVSMTVVYPNPGKFDNVKATLTLVANQIRIKTGTGSGYAESPVGSDARFLYNYAAVPQKIAMGNAQDDPGLFITAIASNIADQRYLPFENAGAISSWHLEMPQSNNEVDLSTVGDIMLHLYYTALDGGAPLQQAVEAYNAANLPTSGIKVFSAQNDFAAPAPTAANPYPVSPWQAFLGKPLVTTTTLAWPITASQPKITVASNSGFPAVPFLVSIGSEILEVTAVGSTGNTSWTVSRAQQGSAAAPASEDAVVLLPSGPPSQVLTLAVSPSKFPAWTRGKTISVTSLTVLVISWPPGTFALVPQAPLPTTLINMQPVAGATEPNVCTSGVITLPANTPLGTWSFELQLQGATNFNSLSKNAIGDVLLLVNYQVS